jgi:hypothetical protein
MRRLWVAVVVAMLAISAALADHRVFMGSVPPIPASSLDMRFELLEHRMARLEAENRSLNQRVNEMQESMGYCLEAKK